MAIGFPIAIFQLVTLFLFFLHLQPILKGLPGDVDHVADADCLEQFTSASL